MLHLVMNIEYAIYKKKYKLPLGVKREVKENYEIQKNYFSSILFE